VSIETSAICPSTRFVRSLSSIQTESPSRYSGSTIPKKNIPPDASRFSFTETTPSSGALSTRLSITCCARCIAIRALLRFSSTTWSEALLVSDRDLTSSSSCARRRLASSNERTFF
jgi:hypothetical protein